MFAQYNEEEMGPLDCEEIEGHIQPNDECILKLADDFEYQKTEGLRLNQEIGRKVLCLQSCSWISPFIVLVTNPND